VACRWIEKVGLAAVVDRRLLVVRKRGGSVFILPGGKPERGESDLQALTRELSEELGCSVEAPVLVGTFKDVAAGHDDAVVVVRLYAGKLVGNPEPQAEIAEQAWLDLGRSASLPLAPSMVNSIVPHLRKRFKAGAPSVGGAGGEVVEQAAQGLLELV
jgi:8-oxo-dGTP diphosphatase